jgi:hypothetical protein
MLAASVRNSVYSLEDESTGLYHRDDWILKGGMRDEG